MFRQVYYFIAIFLSGEQLVQAADMHLQTSANPITQHIKIQLPDENIDVFLDNPGVTYTKSQKHHLTYISFVRLNTLYHIWFYPKEHSEVYEAPALVKQFQNYEDNWLLEGSVRTFDREGNILTETHWSEGRMHGPQRIFSKKLKLIEKREYERGLPVGTWTTYYENESVASEIEFPESLVGWETTLVPYHEEDITITNEIQVMPYYQPVTVKSTWYNQDSLKQRERLYEIYFDGEDISKSELVEEKFFDHSGRVSRESRLSGKSGIESSTLRAGSNDFHTTRHWINGVLFKTESTKIQNQPPKKL